MMGRLRAALVVLALIVAALCLGYLSARFHVQGDWSAGADASLTPTSRAIVKELDAPVQITSFARPGGTQRAQIAAFVQRYQRINPAIALRFIDPDQDPEATREAGITVNGELRIRYRDHERYLTELSERDLTNALESLARGSDRIVAFVTGAGERSPIGAGPGDLGSFVSQLEKRGIRALPLDFSQVPQVPENTRLVVLASPRQTLSAGAVHALLQYVDAGGNLLWLAEPDPTHAGLTALARSLAIEILPGVLVDGNGRAAGLTDPRLVTTATYPPQAITRGFALTTVFPRVAALAQARLGEWNVQPVLRSSAQSWSEQTPIDATHPSTIDFDSAAGDRKGPLNFGLALTRLSASPSHNQQRVAVIGGGAFLSNAYLGQGANRGFGERLFNWLLGDDALIGVPPRRTTAAALTLSQGQLDALATIWLVIVPLLLVVAGLGIGWRRRRR